MKKSRIIAPALGVLILSTAASITGTVAWFTANNSVALTGMQVKTQVSSNLQISEDHQLIHYANSLSQVKKALLEPASSIDGINFYWTAANNVNGAGDAIDESYTLYNEDTDIADVAVTGAGKTKYDNEFNDNYGITTPDVGYGNVAYGYLDYEFYLQATNVNALAANLKLSKLSLKYNDGMVTDNAWRIALIAHEAVADTAYSTAWAAADVVSIFKFTSATNFDNTPKAIGSSGLMALNYGSSYSTYNREGVVASVAGRSTGYYKVAIRLWLEGEDTSCTNATYAALTGDYTLDVAFDFDNAVAVKSNLESIGIITVSQAKEAGDTVTTTQVDGEERAITLNPYKTSLGVTLYCVDNAATAESIFYTVSGTVATKVGTQPQIR